MVSFTRLLLVLALLAATAPAHGRAQPQCDTFSGLPVPRFVSLRFDEAVGRSGPSEGHPKAWVYRRAGLPVQVLQETPDWRKVRDPDGEEVWMHRRLLSGRRAVWATQETDLHARPDAESGLVAVIEPRAVLWMGRCRSGWCRLEAEGRRGWARADAFWGVEPADTAPPGALEAGAGPCYRSDPQPVETAAAG